MTLDKLQATRKRIFTFLGAYKGDNALLTVNDYNNLVEALDQRNGKTEMIFNVKGNELRLVSTGGGCLVGGSGCIAGTVTLDKYKAATGFTQVKKLGTGIYEITLDKLGLGSVAEAEVYFTNLRGFTKAVKTTVLGEITKLTVTVYDPTDVASDVPIDGSFMHLVFYDKILDTIAIV